jgi:hypothetical protein
LKSAEKIASVDSHRLRLQITSYIAGKSSEAQKKDGGRPHQSRTTASVCLAID